MSPNDPPRVEKTDDEGYILIEKMSDVVNGLRSVVRIIGFLLMALVISMAGMSYLLNHLSNETEELDRSIDHVDQVVIEARDASRQTSQDLRAALDASADPERTARLQRAFETIFNLENRLNEHIEQSGG